MNTNLLGISLRQCVALDLGNALREVIKRDYFQAPSSFETDLLLISKIRNKVANISQESVGEDTIELLTLYYGYLLEIRKRFADDCVEFQWFTTIGYGPEGPTRSNSLVVEQINVIFQLGAVYSILALRQSRQDVAGLKSACNFFQLSTGCFDHMLDLGQETPHVPHDLGGETILFLKQLMLAQAQETVWQNAIFNSSTSGKDSVIARLSIQVSLYYDQAYKHGKASDLIKLEWLNHVAVKKYHFKAAANYRMSLVNLQGFQYGNQVAYLRVASKDCEIASNFKRYVGSLVLDDLNGLSTTINETLRVAERDNDLVYLKVVPAEGELKQIEGTSMVKSIIPSTPEKRIFKDLLPYIIIQVTQAYRERQDKFVKDTIVFPIENMNKSIAKFLTDRNLPSSIDSLQQSENLPDSIIQHSQDINSKGGTHQIEVLLKELNSLSGKCEQLVDQCAELINLNKTEEDMLVQRGSAKMPIDEAAGELITRINSMNDYLKQALTGDQQIVNNYYEIRLNLQIFCEGYLALRQAIPDSKLMKLDNYTISVLNDLRSCVNEYTSLERSRKQFLQKVDIKSRNNDIMPNIMEEYKRNHRVIFDNGNLDDRAFEPIYDAHIAMFNSDLKFVSSLETTQRDLERELDMLNRRFVKEVTRPNDESQMKRQEVLQTMELTYTMYVELMSNLSEGLKFYQDFLSKGTVVLRDCENYLYNRRVEARQLEAQMNNSPTQIQSPEPNKPGLWDPSKQIRFG
jgi:programmed cell death 6-interacting protein